MEIAARFVSDSYQLLLVAGAIVVILVSVYVFLRAVANGEGAIVGIKKLWSILWKNLP